jgi:hypothetical protein
LKVSARALAETFEELRRAQPSTTSSPPGGSSLILQLIDEEFLNFQSLGDDGEAHDTGSEPLDTLMGTAAPAYDPAAPLSLEDFGAGSSAALVDEPDPVRSSGERAPARAEPPSPAGRGPRSPSRMPSPAPRKESSMLPWIVVLALLAVGSGAYYWLVVLGNLSKFTG